MPQPMLLHANGAYTGAELQQRPSLVSLWSAALKSSALITGGLDQFGPLGHPRQVGRRHDHGRRGDHVTEHLQGMSEAKPMTSCPILAC